MWSRIAIKAPSIGVRNLITTSTKVKEAIRNGDPVVALESTIITHGMPYPQNLQMVREVERIIEDQGVVPATVAIIDGRPVIGADEDQLEHLAMVKNTIKVSRRDIAYAAASGVSGGTTVSGTMFLANKIGLDIFVTGGIGGVHRGSEITMDVSADLTELGRTPMGVISAGIKSLLDIEKTLEFLETQGVCVATYGSSRTMPGFFTSSSPFESPYNVQDPEEAAQLIFHQKLLGVDSGILIAVPVPESEQANGQLIEKAIAESLRECKEKNIKGKLVTPFVLERINRISKGKSLDSNVTLIKNNALVGALISRQLSVLKSEGATSSPKTEDFVIFGGCNFDTLWKIEDKRLKGIRAATYEASVKLAAGGVGYNIASALANFGLSPRFVSAIGDDVSGDFIKQNNRNLKTDFIVQSNNLATATYCSVLDADGEVQMELGDMKIHDLVDDDVVNSTFKELNPKIVIFDGNLTESAIYRILQNSHERKIPSVFEPTNPRKAHKAFGKKGLTVASPNYAELLNIRAFLSGSQEPVEPETEPEKIIEDAKSASEKVLEKSPGLKALIVTLGRHGVIVAKKRSWSSIMTVRDEPENFTLKYYPPKNVVEDVVSVSGAGDCFVSAFIAALIKGHDEETAVGIGFEAATISLRSGENVPESLSEIEWN